MSRELNVHVKFGISLPNVFHAEPPAADSIAEMVRSIEELGFDSIWVHDRILHESNHILDPLTVLSYAAALTKRVRIGIFVIFPLRNPVLLAKAVSTLDHLSTGRVMVALSLGGTHPFMGEREYAACGVPIGKRVRLFLDGLRLMKALWTGDNVTHDYDSWKLENAKVLPRPLQKPHPPIWFGGSSDAVLRRAARFANGWFAGSNVTPEAFAQSWLKVLGYAERFGREGNELEPAKTLYIRVDDDMPRARGFLVSALKRYYAHDYNVDRLCAFGPPAICSRSVKEFIKAGARTVVFSMVGASVEEIEIIAKEVVPGVF